MENDVSLRNKYDRLCLEFNKLRKKYKEYKDSTTQELTFLKEPQQCAGDPELRIHNLEEECERLRLQNSRMLKNLHCNVQALEPQVKTVVTDVHPDSKLTEPLIPQTTGSVFSTPRSLPAALPCHCKAGLELNARSDFNNLPEKSQSENEEHTLQDFMVTLKQWSSSIPLEKHEVFASESRLSLVKKVGQLESQVCELRVQLQLERKRRLMNTKVDLTHDPGFFESRFDEGDPKRVENLLIESLKKRIETLTDEANRASSLTVVLQDELMCLVPHIQALAIDFCKYQTAFNASQSTVLRLNFELEDAKADRLRYYSEMTEYVGNLTNELQRLRDSKHRVSSDTFITPNDSESVKNVLLKVLKR